MWILCAHRLIAKVSSRMTRRRPAPRTISTSSMKSSATWSCSRSGGGRAVAQSKAEKSWAVLQQLDVSQPTRTRVTPLDEPEISPPPEPPARPKPPQEEAPEPDPFDLAKEKYRVDLVEV